MRFPEHVFPEAHGCLSLTFSLSPWTQTLLFSLPHCQQFGSCQSHLSLKPHRGISQGSLSSRFIYSELGEWAIPISSNSFLAHYSRFKRDSECLTTKNTWLWTLPKTHSPHDVLYWLTLTCFCLISVPCSKSRMQTIDMALHMGDHFQYEQWVWLIVPGLVQYRALFMIWSCGLCLPLVPVLQFKSLRR